MDFTTLRNNRGETACHVYGSKSILEVDRGRGIRSLCAVPFQFFLSLQHGRTLSLEHDRSGVLIRRDGWPTASEMFFARQFSSTRRREFFWC